MDSAREEEAITPPHLRMCLEPRLVELVRKSTVGNAPEGDESDPMLALRAVVEGAMAAAAHMRWTRKGLLGEGHEAEERGQPSAMGDSDETDSIASSIVDEEVLPPPLPTCLSPRLYRYSQPTLYQQYGEVVVEAAALQPSTVMRQAPFLFSKAREFNLSPQRWESQQVGSAEEAIHLLLNCSALVGMHPDQVALSLSLQTNWP